MTAAPSGAAARATTALSSTSAPSPSPSLSSPPPRPQQVSLPAAGAGAGVAFPRQEARAKASNARDVLLRKLEVGEEVTPHDVCRLAEAIYPIDGTAFTCVSTSTSATTTTATTTPSASLPLSLPLLDRFCYTHMHQQRQQQQQWEHGRSATDSNSSVTTTSTSATATSRIVRVVGMVQDLFDPEYYASRVLVKPVDSSKTDNGGTGTSMCTRYRDSYVPPRGYAVVPDEEDVDGHRGSSVLSPEPSSSSSLGVRHPALIVPLPFSSPWFRRAVAFGVGASGESGDAHARAGMVNGDNDNGAAAAVGGGAICASDAAEEAEAQAETGYGSECGNGTVAGGASTTAAAVSTSKRRPPEDNHNDFNSGNNGTNTCNGNGSAHDGAIDAACSRRGKSKRVSFQETGATPLEDGCVDDSTKRAGTADVATRHGHDHDWWPRGCMGSDDGAMPVLAKLYYPDDDEQWRQHHDGASGGDASETNNNRRRSSRNPYLASVNTKLKLNDVVELVGVLSEQPMEADFSSSSACSTANAATNGEGGGTMAMEMGMDMEMGMGVAMNTTRYPPPSRLPRLHVLLHRRLDLDELAAEVGAEAAGGDALQLSNDGGDRENPATDMDTTDMDTTEMDQEHVNDEGICPLQQRKFVVDAFAKYIFDGEPTSDTKTTSTGTGAAIDCGNQLTRGASSSATGTATVAAEALLAALLSRAEREAKTGAILRTGGGTAEGGHGPALGCASLHLVAATSSHCQELCAKLEGALRQVVSVVSTIDLGGAPVAHASGGQGRGPGTGNERSTKFAVATPEKKDGGRMVPSQLQLPQSSLLLVRLTGTGDDSCGDLDDTVNGGSTGRRNGHGHGRGRGVDSNVIHAVKSIAERQTVPVRFDLYELDFEADYRVVVVSSRNCSLGGNTVTRSNINHDAGGVEAIEDAIRCGLRLKLPCSDVDAIMDPDVVAIAADSDNDTTAAGTVTKLVTPEKVAKGGKGGGDGGRTGGGGDGKEGAAPPSSNAKASSRQVCLKKHSDCDSVPPPEQERDILPPCVAATIRGYLARCRTHAPTVALSKEVCRRAERDFVARRSASRGEGSGNGGIDGHARPTTDLGFGGNCEGGGRAAAAVASIVAEDDLHRWLTLTRIQARSRCGSALDRDRLRSRSTISINGDTRSGNSAATTTTTANVDDWNAALALDDAVRMRCN